MADAEQPPGKLSCSDHFKGWLNWLKSPAGIVLILLTAQSTSSALLMRFSKTMDRDVEKLGPPYLSTVSIFLSECIKMPVCLVMAAYCTRGEKTLWELIREEIIGQPWITAKTGVPAIAYTAQGNLILVAVANLEAPVYQVVYQCKTLFTAVFSRILLNR